MAGRSKPRWPRCFCNATFTLFRTGSTRCANCAQRRVRELRSGFEEAPRARVVLALPLIPESVADWDLETKLALATFMQERCAEALEPLSAAISEAA